MFTKGGITAIGELDACYLGLPSDPPIHVRNLIVGQGHHSGWCFKAGGRLPRPFEQFFEGWSKEERGVLHLEVVTASCGEGVPEDSHIQGGKGQNGRRVS